MDKADLPAGHREGRNTGISRQAVPGRRIPRAGATAGATTMALQRLEHFLIQTVDMPVTRDWYVQVLGLTPGPAPEFHFPVCWLHLDDVPLLHLAEGGEHVPEARKAYLGQQSRLPAAAASSTTWRSMPPTWPGRWSTFAAWRWHAAHAATARPARCRCSCWTPTA